MTTVGYRLCTTWMGDSLQAGKPSYHEQAGKPSYHEPANRVNSAWISLTGRHNEL